MYTATALLALTSVALAQEVGLTGGANVASGVSGISTPNINSGWQSKSSLFVDGSSAAPAGLLNNVVGSTFSHVNSNSAVEGNIINNPSKTDVSGNDGWTANGDANNLGPVQNQFGAAPGVAPIAGAIPFLKRGGDVVFADNHHQQNVAAATGLVQPAFVQPAFVHPWAAALPAADPALAQPIAGLGLQQNAAVVGGIVKRGGDVVFANNHHQLSSVAGLVAGPAFAPFAYGWPAAHALPFALPAAIPAFRPVASFAPLAPLAPVAPVVPAHNANAQQATVIQNQA